MGTVRVDRAASRTMSKKERRELRRERAREERRRQARLRRRRRIVTWIVGAVGTVAVLVLVATMIVSHIREGMAGPANMASDGLLWEGAGDGETFAAATTAALDAGAEPTTNASDIASTGVLDLQIYLDPTDADSATFWTTHSADLEYYLQQSAITLEVHPVSFDGSDASLAAVSAFGCVADASPDLAWAYLGNLLGATAEGSAPAGDDLVDLAVEAEVGVADTQDCISGGGFRSWASAASDRAAESVPYAAEATAVDGAPVIVAAGQVYTGALDDADAFNTFLGEAYSAAVGE